jgi:hypothetical protein
VQQGAVAQVDGLAAARAHAAGRLRCGRRARPAGSRALGVRTARAARGEHAGERGDDGEDAPHRSRRANSAVAVAKTAAT